ncbi:MAG: hypothetical protein QGH45_21465 [Myxococcota bacterium]|jgi:hypothetical protein|nr:hypothetical protein [Myxococcota bacterium]
MSRTSSFFVVKGSNDITSITASWPGRKTTLRFDPSGAFSVKKGGNLKLNSDFAVQVGAHDALTLICDGTDWIEVSRSTN